MEVGAYHEYKQREHGAEPISSECTSSVNLAEFAANRTVYVQSGRKGKSGLVLHPGSPCNNYKGRTQSFLTLVYAAYLVFPTGYCDIFRKCRSVDANGPLARLKNLLFNRKTIETVTQWVQVSGKEVVFFFVLPLIVSFRRSGG